MVEREGFTDAEKKLLSMETSTGLKLTGMWASTST